jgi:hypothetical protein
MFNFIKYYHKIQLFFKEEQNHLYVNRFMMVFIVACFWYFSFLEFSTPHEGMFRLDRKDQIAVPNSDARIDLMNGLAILNGDGFVNWRPLTRHQVYKPGWSLTLAGVAALHGRELPAMQNTLIMIYSLAIPLLFLLVCVLFEEGIEAGWSFLVAYLYLKAPTTSWELYSTMMTEGLTTVLVLGFLLSIAWVCRQEKWSLWAGFFIGILAASLELIRSQSRYGILAVMLLITLLALRRFRFRSLFLVYFILGYILLLMPFYGKTMLQQRELYLGTSYTSLRAVLQYSELGQKAGGEELSAEESATEQLATKVFRERVSSVVKERITQPYEVLFDGSFALNKYLFDSPLKMTGGTKSPTIRLFIFYILCLACLVLAVMRGNFLVLILPLFVIGYFTPNLLFAFYLQRFGDPVGWVGLTLIFGLVIQLSRNNLRDDFKQARQDFSLFAARIENLINGKSSFRFANLFNFSHGIRDLHQALQTNRKQLILQLVFLSLMFLLSLSALFTFNNWDNAPLKFPTTQVIMNQPQVKELFQNASPELLSLYTNQLTAIAHGNGKQENFKAGFIAFPQTLEPTDKPFVTHGETYPTPTVTTTYFFLITPWKLGGFDIRRFALESPQWTPHKTGQPALLYRRNGFTQSATTVDAIILLPFP